MRWLLADWGENKRHIFDAVAEGLRDLQCTVTNIRRNDMNRRPALLGALASGDFDALLTWQRFYPMQRDLVDGVRESGIRTVFMDFGFIPHYKTVVFDTDGENAASSWLRMWETGGAVSLGAEDKKRVDGLLREHAVAARAMNLPDVDALKDIRFPFVFIPLQRPGDSVVRYDSQVHDFGQLVRRILLLSRGCFFVVCKTHPMDRDIDLGVPDRIAGNHVIIRTGNGQQNEALCDYLLSRAALVVGVNSNMLFRATVYGTPVLATGRGWYTGSGAIHEVDGVDQLTVLQTGPLGHDALQRYLATCLARQLHFDDLGNPEKIARVFETIGVRLPGTKVCS